ncbi:MAG TPA: hypothetical protein VHI52_22040 [Verrucomicrobiae bacterium]|nr:hypothetical protein [Verrucomicrobiae bacterium]
MADTARKNYEHAIRTGQKFQEEAGQWWTRMLTQTATAAEWQRNVSRFAAMAGNTVPLAQDYFEHAVDVMQKSGQSGAELVQKAMEAAQTPGLAECQAKWMEFWTSSMKAAQSNIEAVTQLGTHGIDSWIAFVRKNSETTSERVPHGA